MAIRYSGDVEIRMHFRRGFVLGEVTDGRNRYRAKIRRTGIPSTDGYDRLAEAFLSAALRAAKARGVRLPADTRGGTLRIRRTFQAPCSVGDSDD